MGRCDAEFLNVLVVVIIMGGMVDGCGRFSASDSPIFHGVDAGCGLRGVWFIW